MRTYTMEPYFADAVLSGQKITAIVRRTKAEPPLEEKDRLALRCHGTKVLQVVTLNMILPIEIHIADTGFIVARVDGVWQPDSHWETLSAACGFSSKAGFVRFMIAEYQIDKRKLKGWWLSWM